MCLIVAQTMIQETWLPGRCLAMNVRSHSDILTFRRHATIYIRGNRLPVSSIFIIIQRIIFKFNINSLTQKLYGKMHSGPYESNVIHMLQGTQIALLNFRLIVKQIFTSLLHFKA
jgi:hypothetical protein